MGPACRAYAKLKRLTRISCSYWSSGGGGGRKRKTADPSRKFPRLSDAEIDMINEDWQNNEMTTMMWEIISQAQLGELKSLLHEHPEIAHIRSEDGRGPMWWAHEYGRTNMIKILKSVGVSEERTDESGLRPTELSNK